VNVRGWLRRVTTRLGYKRRVTDPLRTSYDPKYSRISNIDITRMPGRTTRWPQAVERFDVELNEEHE
jgi:hypothetical protein